MPRVKGLTFLQKSNNQRKKLTQECEHLMLDKDISRKDIAEYVGKTPQAIGQQFRNNTINLETLLGIIALTNPSQEELGKMMRMEG